MVTKEEQSIPGALNVALLIGVATSLCALLWLASHGSTWQIVLAVVAFSFLNNTMFSLLHESVHGIAHRDRRINDLMGCFAAAFFPTGFTLQRVFHLGHHANNRTEEEQFDYIRPSDRPLLKRAQWYAILTGLYWVFVPLGAATYFIAPGLFTSRLLRSRNSPVAVQTGSASMFSGLARASRTRVRTEILFTIFVQLSMFFLLHLHFSGWLLCYAAFGFNWSSLQYTDHAFSPLDVHEGAWNLRVNPLTRLVFLNYHHHRAHHQSPQVPWIHLGALVDRAAERPSFWMIYRAMWRGPRPISEARRVIGG